MVGVKLGVAVATACALMLTEAPVNPDELAVNVMVPAPIDWTIARHLPLKACRLLPLYDFAADGVAVIDTDQFTGARN